MTGRASQLGTWVSGLRRDHVPVELIEKMRDHLLDTIGAAIVGDGREPVLIAEEVFRAPGAVPVLINAAPRHIVDAARVTAVAAHAAEIDDTEGCDHTGAVVVPTVLALLHATDPRPTGDDLLTALVAGYEVGRRMQNALGGYDAHNESGWHSTATCGVFAAAAAAAHLLHLTPPQTTSALAIAASSSAGGWAFAADGSMTKQLHVANAAGTGLQAALLAQAGATGPECVFDDVWGSYFTTHGNPQTQPDALIADLGTTWHAAHSAIKMYAACRSAHPALDGLSDLIRDHAITSEQVTRITIELSPFLRRMICPDNVTTIEAARMSLPISIALKLEGANLHPDDYLRFADHDIVELLARTTIIESTTRPYPQSTRVTVHTVNAAHVIDRRHARGSENSPISTADVRRKFLRLCDGRIPDAIAQALVDYVKGLDRSPADAFPAVLTNSPGLSSDGGEDAPVGISRVAEAGAGS